MVSEQFVLLLFRSCLSGYLIGAALALAFTRRQRLANVLGFSSSCLGGLAGMAASYLCLQHGTSPAFDLLPLTTPLFPFAVKLDPLGCVLRTPHFAVGRGHLYLLHRLLGALLRHQECGRPGCLLQLAAAGQYAGVLRQPRRPFSGGVGNHGPRRLRAGQLRARGARDPASRRSVFRDVAHWDRLPGARLPPALQSGRKFPI